MTNSKKNKEIPVLDQSDTDRDDIDHYFTISAGIYFIHHG